jgi:hypothetical protein
VREDIQLTRLCIYPCVLSAGAIRTPQVTKKTRCHIVSSERFILDIDVVGSWSRKAACSALNPSCLRSIWCWRPSNGPRICGRSLPRQVKRRTQLHGNVFWREVRLVMGCMAMENFRNRTFNVQRENSFIIHHPIPHFYV